MTIHLEFCTSRPGLTLSFKPLSSKNLDSECPEVISRNPFPIGSFMKPFFCFATLLGFFVTHQIKAAEKPNIILILCDDVGFECFGSYGSREYKTPRLDALAANGVRFENCHSTPLCTPSRVNLMSGKSNVFNYFDFGVYPEGQPTFANYFQEHGVSHSCCRQVAVAYRKGWHHSRASRL